MKYHAPLAGIALALAAVACFATLDTASRAVTLAGVPVLMGLWVRYLFQALFTTLWVLPRRGLANLSTEHPRFHLLRGVLLFFSSLCAFFGLKYLPVGEFTAIVMITPLVVTLASAWRSHQPVGLVRWLLVTGGFMGTLVIARPGTGHFGWPVVFPLALIGVNTGFQLLTSRMSATEDPMLMQCTTGWVGTILASLALPWAWTTITAPGLWAGLALMGVAGTVGHWLLTLAFQRASPPTLMPYMYAQIGFAMLGGLLWFGHVPDGWSLAGMGLIAVCGALGAIRGLLAARREAPDVAG